MNKAQARRLQNGLCVVCSKPNANGYQECDTCSNERKTTRSIQKNKRLTDGLCITCLIPNNNGKEKCDTCIIKQRDWVRERSKNKVAAGLCIRCSLPKTNTQDQCTDCLNKKTKRRNILVENKLCQECMAPLNNDTHIRCNVCLLVDNERTAKRRKFNIENTLCIICSLPTNNNGKQLCDGCSSYRNHDSIEQSRQRREERMHAGFCAWCANSTAPIPGELYCVDCFFKRTALFAMKSNKQWQKVREMFTAQNGLCIYTGIQLVPGTNTALDHIMPKSRGGTNELSNLQWIDIGINRLKHDFMEEEFIRTYKNVIVWRKDILSVLPNERAKTVANLLQDIGIH